MFPKSNRSKNQNFTKLNVSENEKCDIKKCVKKNPKKMRFKNLVCPKIKSFLKSFVSQNQMWPNVKCGPKSIVSQNQICHVIKCINKSNVPKIKHNLK